MTATLGVEEAEKNRLRRALREVVSARGEAESEDLSRELIATLRPFLVSPLLGRKTSPEAAERLLDTLTLHRYGAKLSRSAEIVGEDLVPLDPTPSLSRIRDALMPTANRGSKRIDIVPSEPPLQVLATRGIVEAVLTEILTNAILYSPSGSTVTVKISPFGSDHVEITVENPLPEASDADAPLERFFEPGYRGAKSARLFPGGQGMGLHFAQKSLQVIGGSADVTIAHQVFSVSLRFVRAGHRDPSETLPPENHDAV